MKCYNPDVTKAIDQESSEIEQGLALGNICYGEKACNEYCENNLGRCKAYCKENPNNQLCQKPFAFEARSDKSVGTKVVDKSSDNKETTPKDFNNNLIINKNTGDAVTPIKDNPPVLKNLGLNIEPLNKQTNKAGDFLFGIKDYANKKIFTEFGETITGDSGKKTLPEIGFYVPVGTSVISPIDGVVTDLKLYEPSQDYIISFKTEVNSPWIISFEHIEKVLVANGDKIFTGQELGKVSPSYGKTEFGNVEIAVWQGGNNIFKFCPTMFLEEDLKQEYASKFKQLASDWENFIGQNVYNENSWVYPGCLRYNLTEK